MSLASRLAVALLFVCAAVSVGPDAQAASQQNLTVNATVVAAPELTLTSNTIRLQSNVTQFTSGATTGVSNLVNDGVEDAYGWTPFNASGASKIKITGTTLNKIGGGGSITVQPGFANGSDSVGGFILSPGSGVEKAFSELSGKDLIVIKAPKANLSGAAAGEYSGSFTITLVP